MTGSRLYEAYITAGDASDDITGAALPMSDMRGAYFSVQWTGIRTLDYDGQTGNFAVGETVTGGTSGATAVVVSDNDGGASGTLTVTSVSGTFQNDETLTGNLAGAAVVNGTLTLTAPTGTLTVETSANGTNWNTAQTFATSPAGTESNTYSALDNILALWARLVYTSSSGVGALTAQVSLKQ